MTSMHSNQAKRPRRLFGIHRRGRAAFVGREPLRAVEAWVEANHSRFRPS
jgi:hypothetical protein